MFEHHSMQIEIRISILVVTNLIKDTTQPAYRISDS